MYIVYTFDALREAKMADHFELSEKERHFFSLVKAATLANPFSKERIAVDLEITGLFPDTRRSILLVADNPPMILSERC